MPSNDPKHLDPVVKSYALEHQRRCRAAGIDCIIRSTLRTIKEHDAYYAQGRQSVNFIKKAREDAGLYRLPADEYKKKVTWTITSIHLYDCAWHLVLKRKGKICWDTEADINDNGVTDYEEMVRIAEKMGITCGGRWPKRDWVHYQFTGGLNVEQLQKGKRPADTIPVPQYREPEQQEADMSSKPSTGLIIGSVFRALAFMDTRKDYEGETNAPRPRILSRRAIHSVLGLVSLGLTLALGVDIPEADITKLVDSGAKAWPLLMGFWAVLGGIIGTIKRKK